MSAQATSSAPAVSITGLLGVAFIVLKLCGVITWSWWWVLAPLWVPFAAGMLFLIGVVVVASVGGKSWRK